jgi:hypothetical protein
VQVTPIKIGKIAARIKRRAMRMGYMVRIVNSQKSNSVYVQCRQRIGNFRLEVRVSDHPDYRITRDGQSRINVYDGGFGARVAINILKHPEVWPKFEANRRRLQGGSYECI